MKIRKYMNRSHVQISKFKLRCDSRFQSVLTACVCVSELITLVDLNQRNFFENATACSKRTLKRLSQLSLSDKNQTINSEINKYHYEGRLKCILWQCSKTNVKILCLFCTADCKLPNGIVCRTSKTLDLSTDCNGTTYIGGEILNSDDNNTLDWMLNPNKQIESSRSFIISSLLW